MMRGREGDFLHFHLQNVNSVNNVVPLPQLMVIIPLIVEKKTSARAQNGPNRNNSHLSHNLYQRGAPY